MTIKGGFKKSFSFSITDILDKTKSNLSDKYESQSKRYSNPEISPIKIEKKFSSDNPSYSQNEVLRVSTSEEIDQYNYPNEINYDTDLNTSAFEKTNTSDSNDEDSLQNRIDVYSDYCEENHEINSNDGNYFIKFLNIF